MKKNMEKMTMEKKNNEKKTLQCYKGKKSITVHLYSYVVTNWIECTLLNCEAI